MENIELYDFITSKCKEKNISVESLPSKEISRTTLYRYMKGIIPKSKLVKAERFFSANLKLNASERSTLHDLLYVKKMSSSEVKVMKELDKYIFNNNIKKITKNIDFLYYSDDKYNRSKKEIFDIIFSDSSNFKLNVNIIGCLENESLEFLTEFIDLIKAKEVVNSIEHLIKFTEETYENNLSILLRILSFFELNNYNAKYKEGLNSNFFLNNTIIIDKVSYDDKNHTYYLITFLNNDYPQFLTFDNEFSYKYIERCYENYSADFKEEIVKSRNINMLSDTFFSLEATHDSYLIKRNPCFNGIPTSVYESLNKRYSNEEKLSILKTIFDDENIESFEVESTFNKLIFILNKRLESTYKNNYTNVFCREGLLELVKTKKIDDFFKEIPEFSDEEVKEILEYILERNSNNKDSYKLYITKESIFENNYNIDIYKDSGVLITFNLSSAWKGLCSNIFIENTKIAELFIKYIEEYIPSRHCLSKEETNKFLNNLILTYLN